MRVATPLLVLALLLPAACGPASPGTPPHAGKLTRRPDVLLVTIDTLRREHLGCYGYPRPTSPTIDALAAEGLVFDRALAPMASTLPSHLSLLTGLYAHQHGRTSNAEGVQNPFASGEGVSSFARALGEAGYQTAAFVSSKVLDARTGISDGFATFHCPPGPLNPAMAHYATQHAVHWLEGADERPFFLWVHYWDTHEPNEPTEPHASRLAPDATLREWVAARGIDTALLSEKFREKDRIWERFLLPPAPPGSVVELPADRRVDLERIIELVARYDADLANIDEHLGQVFAKLRELGRWDDAIVVFTADHGQALGELGVLGHGRIINVNTFVPLILRFPDELVPQPARIDTQVSLIDVVPTILGRMPEDFLPSFRAQLEGADVLSGAYAREYSLTQEATEFRRRDGSDLKCALVGKRWKYLYDLEGESALYDLEGEAEERDVSTEHPEVVDELRRILLETIARRPGTASGEQLTEEGAAELIENLRALGYVDDE